MQTLGSVLDRRVPSLGAAVLSGLLIAASIPPWGWWPLAFVGLALLDHVIARRPAAQRFWRGALAGMAWFVPASAWMVSFTPPGWVIFGLWAGLLIGGVCAAVPARSGRWLAFPAALVIGSWIQWRFPFGGVPLASLALAQVGSPLAATARVFGPLMIVGTVGVVVVAIRAGLARRWVSCASAGALALGVAVLVGVAPRSTAIATIDAAVVQGGGPQGTRALYTSSADVFDRHVEATKTITEPVDLVVWPENAVTTRGPFVDSAEYGEVTELAAALDAPIVTSIFEVFDTETYNATVIVYPDGAITNRYDKVIRVPFGEYVPFRALIEPFAPEYLPSRNAVPGQVPNVLSAPEIGGNDTTLGVSISWEVFFARRSRDAVRDGAEVLINPTNGSSYSWTIVQSQQIASSRLRARETDRWLLQAAPTGFSAIIDNDGTVRERTGVSEQKVLVGPIEVRDGSTWAVRFGDWPMMVIALGALAAAHSLAQSDRRLAADAQPTVTEDPTITEDPTVTENPTVSEAPTGTENPTVSEAPTGTEADEAPSGGGDLDEDRDGSVVDQLDGHLGSETPGLDPEVTPGEGGDE